ncbi:MAG: subclass B3 metallo-beta-lactamase [Acidimicrobiia bacterium]
MKKQLLLAMFLCLTGVLAFAQGQPNPAEIPTKPFKIIGNIHYVGVIDPSGKARQDSVSYLITTPQGHILVDTQFDETVPLIRDNIQKLGFRYQDVKILLNSHAHVDHMAGHARMKELTGAQVVISEGDAGVVQDGGRSDFRGNGRELWKPFKPDRIIRDGDTVALGGTTLTAHMTPGHTKGSTTWTMVTQEDGRNYNVVIVGGVRLNANVPLVGNSKYPNIVEDFAKSFRVLKTLPVDVALGVHGYWFGLSAKARLLEQGGGPNPFANAAEYAEYVAAQERAYLAQLQKERTAAR